ncbi:hypothetical protein BDV93DRAFT_563893 [Ceratobasidium sp. AG-I]|nr:hypothetical protein BDV93DRAFT_563893 [Ceratobasidium sp. AG-I]
MTGTKRSASESLELSVDARRASRSRLTTPTDSLAPIPPQLPSDTPLKPGSASASQSQSMLKLGEENPSSHRSKSKTYSLTATSDNAGQDVIDRQLRLELNGASGKHLPIH